jgi:hypothetical protein
MRRSGQDLEIRKQQLILRIAHERTEVITCAAQLVAPAGKLYRLQGRLRRAFAVASDLVSMVLPVAAFLFRSQPAVRRAGQVVMLVRAVRGLARQRAQPPVP